MFCVNTFDLLFRPLFDRHFLSKVSGLRALDIHPAIVDPHQTNLWQQLPWDFRIFRKIKGEGERDRIVAPLTTTSVVCLHLDGFGEFKSSSFFRACPEISWTFSVLFGNRIFPVYVHRFRCRINFGFSWFRAIWKGKGKCADNSFWIQIQIVTI